MGIIMKYLKKEPRVKAEERIPARCSDTKDFFDIILGHESGKMIMLRGERSYTDDKSTYFKSDTKAGLKQINLSNGLMIRRTYHCPACGNKDIVRCGKCGCITCYDGKGDFTCAYCGNSGKVSGTIDRIDAYDCNGVKPDGMKYYPGDKGDKTM